MTTSRRHHPNLTVANAQVTARSPVRLEPAALDDLAEALHVPSPVAAEMFARLAGSDYRRWEAQAARCGYCAHPVRLKGRVFCDGLEVFNSADQPDRVLLKRCGNRRQSACPSCSFQYAGDMWHLLYAGLAGGDKGVPDTIAVHPMVFVTLTAPSFGPVHSTRERNERAQRCRPRREGQLCVHGRATWCMAIHHPNEARLGSALCADCYDYSAAVLFNWWAPELWRRFTIDLYRTLAAAAGMTEAELRELVRISYAKVAEPQHRGLIHFHAIIRLDATGDGWQPPPIDIPDETLAHAVKQATRRAHFDADGHNGQRLRLRFGRQTDVQPIHRPGDLADGELTPQKVAAYLSKYSCKGPENFGVGNRPLDADAARDHGLSDHAVRMVDAACRLAQLEGMERLARWTHMFGFRGHFATHSRRYSTTLSALRCARVAHERRRDRRHPHQNDNIEEAGQHQDDDDTTLLVGEWRFAGVGYTTNGDAALAAASAVAAREWRPLIQRAIEDERRETERWTSSC